MRSPRYESHPIQASPDDVFRAALGVAQNEKSARILAVHNGGRKLVFRERAKLSNPKFFQVWVEDNGAESELNIAVGSDPRSPKALLDGRANQKSLTAFVQKARGVLQGSGSAPVTEVSDHFLQKKTEVPWTDPNQDPEIELDGNFLALYGA